MLFKNMINPLLWLTNYQMFEAARCFER